EEPLPIETMPEYRFYTEHREALNQKVIDEFIGEFDESLEGHVSRLIDYKINNERILADSVREVLGITRGLLSDTEAISLALNPGRNTLLGEALNLATLSKLSRTLFHPSYTFRKKLSHTADSQDQRHRMTPASRPCLHAHLTETPDVIVPELVKQDEEALVLYGETMEQTWEGINRLREMGVADEFAMYLLPNAVAIRFTESADLLNLHHKHAMRLCYNSQEEIWRASLDEALQIREINPEIGRYLLPPCTLRAMAEARPICPEGERFCGIIVWRKDIAEFERVV
ncbi:MAG: FAD-dependent thymidylate synthase, partial [Candidatus Latescibacteria bacterium]|nr:FAD-dependent thymidylate synthase [Candidatus Latescibacterota bacterium]